MQGLMDGVIPAEPETYELVRREAARLGRLVTDVERVSRLEAGAEAIRPRELAVAEAVEAVVAPLRPQFLHSGIAFSVDCPEPCPRIWADPDKFAQILGNLLSNSLRYTPSGGTVKIGSPGPGPDGRLRRGGQRHRHPRRRPASCLREVLPGGQVQIQLERGERHRSSGRQSAHAADGRLHRAWRAFPGLSPASPSSCPGPGSLPRVPAAPRCRLHTTFTFPSPQLNTVRRYLPHSCRTEAPGTHQRGGLSVQDHEDKGHRSDSGRSRSPGRSHVRHDGSWRLAARPRLPPRPRSHRRRPTRNCAQTFSRCSRIAWV